MAGAALVGAGQDCDLATYPTYQRYVLRTQVTTTGIIEDVNGAHGLDYNVDGSGSADLYYQGQQYGAEWSSPDRNSPLVFTNDAGQPITLPGGLVWVDVVPG